MTRNPAEARVAINLLGTESTKWTFEMEDGSNKVSGTIGYQDDFEGWMNRCPVPGSFHPEITGLTLKKISASRIEGFMVDVTLKYESLNPENSYPARAKGQIKRYSMEPGGGEEPLITNDLFKTLSDTEREAALELLASSKTSKDFTTATSKLTSDMGIKFLEKVRKGLDAYRSPALFWVERFSTHTLADVKLHHIYKTTENPPGNPPSAGSERDWLFHPPAVTGNEDGKTWNVENRWELSLPGKWDADLYPSYS